MTTRTFWLLAAVLLGVSGCAAQAELALPMTAAQAVREGSGAALVAYLGQPDANPAVCDTAGAGAHVSALAADARTALVDGLRTGKVPPALWRRCTNRLAKGLSADDSASLFDAMALAYRDLVTSSHPRHRPTTGGRLTALHQLYLDRVSQASGVIPRSSSRSSRRCTRRSRPEEASRRWRRISAIRAPRDDRPRARQPGRGDRWTRRQMDSARGGRQRGQRSPGSPSGCPLTTCAPRHAAGSCASTWRSRPSPRSGRRDRRSRPRC